MHRIFAMPWLLIGGLSALLLGGVPAVSLAKTCSPEVKPLVVLLNSTTRLQLSTKKPIKTVLNPKESVLTLRTVERDPTTVLLVGTAPGVTRLELEDSDGNREVRNVVVQADVEYLTSQLRRAVPLSNVDVIPNGTNSVILTGYTSRAEDIQVLQQVAQSAGFTVINGVRVNGVQQVQLDVVIARVARNKGRNFGINFLINPTSRSSPRRPATSPSGRPRRRAQCVALADRHRPDPQRHAGDEHEPLRRGHRQPARASSASSRPSRPRASPRSSPSRASSPRAASRPTSSTAASSPSRWPRASAWPASSSRSSAPG